MMNRTYRTVETNGGSLPFARQKLKIRLVLLQFFK
jgi:hypothetical protein